MADDIQKSDSQNPIVAAPVEDIEGGAAPIEQQDKRIEGNKGPGNVAGDLNMRRFRVQDCILRLTEKNLSVPVARFQLRFSLDEIPWASIIPAFGRVVFGAGKWASLSDIQEKDAVDLILKVNDTQTLLLRGYISQISTDDTASMFSRRQALRLRVTHRAVKLAGAPSSTFVYGASAGASLDSLALFKNHVNPFKPGPDGAKSVYSSSSVVSWLSEKGEGLAYFPGHVLKEIIKGLFEQYNDLQMSQEDLDEMIHTYDPANVTKILPEPSTFLIYIAEKYSGSWLSQNAWQALIATADDLGLQIVPFNTGFYIANPHSLSRTPARIIKAREYSKVQQGLLADLAEPKDGIVLMSPTGTGGGLADTFSFPNVVIEGDGNDNLLNKYYHYATFPAWIQSSLHYLNGALTPGKEFSPPPNPKFPDEAKSLAAYYKKVGGNLARSMYAKLKQQQNSSTLVFPYRLDLMPGTNIQFDDSDKGISFIGDTTHGMVQTTTIVCDNLAEEPTLMVSVDITALRNAADNADDALTFEGHPIFQDQWVGIDIEGRLLKPIPPVNGPEDMVGEWFDNANGANVNKPVRDPAAHNEQGSLNVPSTS